MMWAPLPFIADAFPHREGAGVARAAETGIETQHDFTEGDAVPSGFSSGFDAWFSHFFCLGDRKNSYEKG